MRFVCPARSAQASSPYLTGFHRLIQLFCKRRGAQKRGGPKTAPLSISQGSMIPLQSERVTNANLFLAAATHGETNGAKAEDHHGPGRSFWNSLT